MTQTLEVHSESGWKAYMEFTLDGELHSVEATATTPEKAIASMLAQLHAHFPHVSTPATID